jgi:hypothetical protein
MYSAGWTSEGKCKMVVFDWNEVAQPRRNEFVESALSGLTAGGWDSDQLVPFALVGQENMLRGGKVFFPEDGVTVLFLDLAGGSGDTCPVKLLDAGGGFDDLVTVAQTVEELFVALGLRPEPPSAPDHSPLGKALERIAPWVDKRCKLKVDDEKRFGRSPRKWEMAAFNWKRWSEGKRSDMIDCYCGELAELYCKEAADGSSVWESRDVIPFAVIGEDGMTEEGPKYESWGGQFDGVFFFDLAEAKADACPVLLWNTESPPQQMLRVADTVEEFLKLVSAK